MNKEGFSGIVDEMAKHWKANHDNLKKRCALLSQRPDLPVDRIPAFQEMKRLQEVEFKTSILLNAMRLISSKNVIGSPVAEQLQEIVDEALIQYELCQDPTCEQADNPHAHVEVILPKRVAQMSGDGPDFEDGPDEDGFKGPRPYNGFASHPSNAATQDAPKPFMELFKVADELQNDLHTGYANWIRRIAHRISAATVPQVVQAPSDEQIVDFADKSGIDFDCGTNCTFSALKQFVKLLFEQESVLPLAASPSIVPTEKYDDTLLPFLSLMRRELHANSGKGDRPGWLSMSRQIALLEIYYHVAKLQKAAKDDDAALIREHGADVANMAMMLVDVCGALTTASNAGEGEQEANEVNVKSKDQIVGHKTLRGLDGTFTHVPLFRQEADKILMDIEARDQWRKSTTPTEQDAVNLLFEAYQRLKELGWKETCYGPTNQVVNVIEVGSTGIHPAIRFNAWPEKCWWIDGDSPSMPILYKPKS